jgi:Mrp family chromosome partitioning ATPase
MALAPVVDGVVLVIDSVTSRRETARRVADELKTARIHVLGAVLTNRTFPIPPSLYRRL